MSLVYISAFLLFAKPACLLIQFRSVYNLILALEVVGASNIQEDDIPELMNNEDISFDIFLTQM